MATLYKRQGFTLIELSIVLVIIGLIVGGVLVGQDMIKAAEVRSTVGQVEKFNAAANAFRSKYGGLPGDLNWEKATNFELETGAAGAGMGDGNGLIEGCSADSKKLGCETAYFWDQMSEAELLEANLTGASGTSLVTAADVAAVSTFLPPSKLHRGNYVTVFTDSGLNYYQMGGVESVAAGDYTLKLAITPLEAFNMDNKIDDGKPLTGTVVALEGTNALNIIATPDAATCALDSTGSPYNTLVGNANTMLCHVRFRVQ